jgi:hypothetical protein
MKTFTRVWLWSVLALAGCAEPEQSPCSPPVAEDRGECTPYTPATVAGSKSGTWASGRTLDTVLLDISDVGGGLVEVTLTGTDHPTEVSVRLQGRPEDEWHPGVDVLVSDSTTLTRGFVLRAQGEKRYQLELRPIGTPAPDKSASYTVTWAYKPNVDCYEHNDSVATAKRLPLDVPIQAYAHAGIIEGDGILVGPSILDFYRFELPSPRRVSLSARKPSDTALTFELWEPASQGALAATDMFAGANEDSTSEELELPAGTHYVRVNTFASQPSTQTTDTPLPADWNRPYTLTIKTR